jgi:hypothetical protein
MSKTSPGSSAQYGTSGATPPGSTFLVLVLVLVLALALALALGEGVGETVAEGPGDPCAAALGRGDALGGAATRDAARAGSDGGGAALAGSVGATGTGAPDALAAGTIDSACGGATAVAADPEDPCRSPGAATTAAAPTVTAATAAIDQNAAARRLPFGPRRTTSSVAAWNDGVVSSVNPWITAATSRRSVGRSARSTLNIRSHTSSSAGGKRGETSRSGTILPDVMALMI